MRVHRLCVFGTLLLTLCFWKALPPVNGSSPPIETRGVWLNPPAFNSTASREDTLQKIAGAHLNTVFALAPPVSGNRGWSTPDNFQALLEAARDHGLSVHAWICNLYRTPGQRANFLSDVEQEAQKDWALSVMREYPELDGIHLDYIRSDTQETVSAAKIAAIQATIGKTREAITREYPDKCLTAATWGLSGEVRSSLDEIPGWFDSWFNDPSNNPINRWKTPGYQSKGYPSCFSVQQDPVQWISAKTIDKIISMEYTHSTSWWKGEVDLWNSFPGNVVTGVYMGLGWYDKVWNWDNAGGDAVTPATVASGIVEKIEYGRTQNICGFSLFELGGIGVDDSVIITALAGDESTPFWEPATSGLTPRTAIGHWSFIPFFVSATVGLCLWQMRKKLKRENNAASR